MKIEYGCDAKGNIELPPGAPFDGENVLIKLAAGWCEARWEPGSKSETQSGTEYEGFCWVCMDAQFLADFDDAREWLPIPLAALTPEKLAAAFECFYIDDNSSRGNQPYVAPTAWFVVDTSRAEPDVNFPGDLVSEHATQAEAKIGYAKACIDFASKS